jgi:hypothetical protein
MLESRWARRIGPGVAALAAVLMVAATAAGARDRPWRPPACRTGAATQVQGTLAWWRMDGQVVDGRLAGQRLTLGAAGAARPRIVDLPAEAFAAGPFGDHVLVGTDDGRRSRLSLIDVARACRLQVADTADVIRRATMTPDRSAIIEFRVDRATRSERGVFRRPLAPGGRVTRLLGPIPPDAQFGPTWTTELVWGSDARSLAVQSCGVLACRTRVLDLATGSVQLVSDMGQGDLVGLAGGRLVVHEACGGLPCPIVSVDVEDGDRVVLQQDGGQAVMASDPVGRALIVLEAGADGRRLRVMDPLGNAVRDLRPDPLGRRLVAGPARSGGAMAPVVGHVVIAPAGRLPVGGRPSPVLRRLSDDTTLAVEEVDR